jgi:hypothetical protein
MIKPDTMLRRRDDIAWREIEGAAIVVTPAEGVVHEFNGTATFLWRKLDEPSTPRRLAELLAGEFDVDAKTALADTIEIMLALVEKGIVEEGGTGDGIRNTGKD